MPFSSARQWVGLGLEITRGTAVTPTYFIPVKSPQWTPVITQLMDQGLRGSMVTDYDQISGLRHDTFDFTCDVYADTFPIFLRAALGSTDAVTGTGAPYSHVIGLLNTGDGQPPSYTISYFDGNEMWQMAGGQLDELTLKFNATGLLEATLKWLAFPAAVVTTVSPTFTAIEAIQSWNCAVTLNSVVITKTMDGELDFKRGTKPIEAITGTQAPYRLWAGPLVPSGKLTLVHEADAGEIALYLANTKVPLEVKFTDLASNTIDFLLSTTAFKTGKPVGSKEWIEYETELTPLPNSTDAVAGGVSPVKATVNNSQSTAY